MLAENIAEQGGGRRNPDGFRGRQRSYAVFYATSVALQKIGLTAHLNARATVRFLATFGFANWMQRRVAAISRFV